MPLRVLLKSTGSKNLCSKNSIGVHRKKLNWSNLSLVKNASSSMTIDKITPSVAIEIAPKNFAMCQFPQKNCWVSVTSSAKKS
jgi:hypothetical protein